MGTGTPKDGPQKRPIQQLSSGDFFADAGDTSEYYEAISSYSTGGEKGGSLRVIPRSIKDHKQMGEREFTGSPTQSVVFLGNSHEAAKRVVQGGLSTQNQ